MAEYRHLHYDMVREPTFPKKPDISKGELASGATITRTDVWHDPKEPAIVSVAKFSPENYRPAGWAENAPMPTTTVPDGHLDFRSNRLPLTMPTGARGFIFWPRPLASSSPPWSGAWSAS